MSPRHKFMVEVSGAVHIHKFFKALADFGGQLISTSVGKEKVYFTIDFPTAIAAENFEKAVST